MMTSLLRLTVVLAVVAGASAGKCQKQSTYDKVWSSYKKCELELDGFSMANCPDQVKAAFERIESNPSILAACLELCKKEHDRYCKDQDAETDDTPEDIPEDTTVSNVGAVDCGAKADPALWIRSVGELVAINPKLADTSFESNAKASFALLMNCLNGDMDAEGDQGSVSIDGGEDSSPCRHFASAVMGSDPEMQLARHSPDIVLWSGCNDGELAKHFRPHADAGLGSKPPIVIGSTNAGMLVGEWSDDATIWSGECWEKAQERPADFSCSADCGWPARSTIRIWEGLSAHLADGVAAREAGLDKRPPIAFVLLTKFSTESVFARVELRSLLSHLYNTLAAEARKRSLKNMWSELQFRLHTDAVKAGVSCDQLRDFVNAEAAKLRPGGGGFCFQCWSGCDDSFHTDHCEGRPSAKCKFHKLQAAAHAAVATSHTAGLHALRRVRAPNKKDPASAFPGLVGQHEAR